MEHTKTVLDPAKERTYVEYVTCDLCGKKIEKKHRFDAEEVVVKHRTGVNYPEGGSGEVVSVDLCGDCFDHKLLPWLATQNVLPAMVEWDW